MLKTFNILFLSLLLCSCDLVVYSPNEIRPDFKDLNQKKIAELANQTATANYKFIVAGDIQRFYDELEDFTAHVNSQPDVNFVLLDGDLVDFGLNREFNWIAERLNKLNKPYISVIGNHDMVANGRKVYNEMFGAENFSFSYGTSKFICLNTNSREVEFNGTLPDINFLKSQLATTQPRHIFTISHVPPFSGDFDDKLETAYAQALAANPRVKYSFHGHDHAFSISEPYGDGVTYVVTASAKKRSYVLVTVAGDDVQVAQQFY